MVAVVGRAGGVKRRIALHEILQALVLHQQEVVVVVVHLLWLVGLVHLSSFILLLISLTKFQNPF